MGWKTQSVQFNEVFNLIPPVDTGMIRTRHFKNPFCKLSLLLAYLHGICRCCAVQLSQQSQQLQLFGFLD